VVVLRCHVHDEVGPVAGGVAFVGAGVAERVVWAWLGSVLPVEAGGGIGCAALRDVSISTGVDGLDAKSLQGKHPFHFRKSLPVAIAGTEHSGVVGSSAGAILKGEEDGEGNVGKERIVHSGKDSQSGWGRPQRPGWKFQIEYVILIAVRAHGDKHGRHIQKDNKHVAHTCPLFSLVCWYQCPPLSGGKDSMI